MNYSASPAVPAAGPTLHVSSKKRLTFNDTQHLHALHSPRTALAPLGPTCTVRLISRTGATGKYNAVFLYGVQEAVAMPSGQCPSCASGSVGYRVHRGVRAKAFHGKTTSRGRVPCTPERLGPCPMEIKCGATPARHCSTAVPCVPSRSRQAD